MGNARINFLLAAFLFILALAIRIEYLSVVQHDQPIRGDAVEYFSYAYNLYHLGIYSSTLPTSEKITPDAARSPGYPLFITPLFYGAESISSFLNRVFLLQAIIGGLTVVLSFFLFKLFFGYCVSAVFSLLIVFNPQLIAIGANLLSETLFTFLLIAAVLLHCIGLQRGSLLLWAAAGLMYGVSASVRPSALFLGPFIVFIHCGYHYVYKHYLTHRQDWGIGLFLFCFVLMQVPFFVRNVIAIDTPLAEGDRAWGNFVLGSYPNFLHQGGTHVGYPRIDDPLFNEMVANKELAVAVLFERIQAQPLTYLQWYTIGKLIAMWQWDMAPGGAKDVYVFPLKKYPFDEDKQLVKVRAVMKALSVPIQMLSVIGVIIVIRNMYKREAQFLLWLVPLTVVFYYVLMLQVLFPIPRLTLPIRPLAYLFAAIGFSHGYEHVKRLWLSGRSNQVSNC